ncbi:ABC transporter permease [Virgibacillus necropolis]|uniref:Putative hemin transport system permease protein HrtB n=1 Tax=Virgibacillus necropolis TaxID=163877 RepID=A0A221M7L6_9BACI|nr:ABC transporter permease [Virgibacillus necropolis]ASN03624.1 ABC transporter permease [Virgibacillus necropolis]
MFLAIRELTHAKFRYILISVIMVLIAMLIFIISGLAQGLSSDNASAVQNLQADYLVLEKDVEHKITRSLFPADKLETIQETEGVEAAVTLSVNMTSATEKGSDKQIDVALFTTDENSMLIPEVSSGETFSAPGQSELILDDSMKQEGVRLGDELQLGGSDQIFTVVGFTEKSRFSHTPVAYVGSGALGASNGKISAVALQVAEGKSETVKSELSGDFDILTKDELLKGIPGYSQEQASLTMMIVFLFVIGTFVLAVFFYVLTLQKTDQFGVLKALGTKTSYLIRNAISQVVLISVICIGIALGLTYGAATLFPKDLPFVLNITNMLQFSTVLLVVTILGSLLSLIQIVKVDPIQAIEGGAN